MAGKRESRQLLEEQDEQMDSYGNPRYSSDEQNRETNSVNEIAERIQSCLGNEFPTIVKCLLPSHVSGGFWLGLSKDFCRMHLPKHDSRVILVDEIGEEYETIYLANRTGLSGGWRRFSIAHRLVEGDALVFQLIEPCKFKIANMEMERFGNGRRGKEKSILRWRIGNFWQANVHVLGIEVLAPIV